MSTEYRGFTKRLSHGHSFSGTSIYDGVFAGGGSKKLGVSSRIEDYAEIFGGPRDSRRSSIPVLEFPGLHERKAQVDVRTSKLDYSKIFGGFGDSDGALTFEELANDKPSEGPVKRTRDGGQSTPELSVSRPTENQVLSREASNGSRDKPKRFNLSYSQVNIGSNDEINKRVHIAQLGDVPGYTCIIEETAPVTKAKGDKPQAPASNGYCNGDAGDGMLNDCEKATPGVSATHTDKPSTKEDNSMHKSGQSRSFLNDPLFGMYEYGLSKETFGVQSPINLPNSPCTKVENRCVSPTGTSEDVAGVYSLPDFDEQVDANSIAATSAAAVKIAIEKAQAKIKVAKERMERRKEGLQGRVRSKEKFRSQDKGNVKGAEKISKFTGEEPQELCETDATAQLIAGTREDYPVKSDSVTLESGYTENLSSSESFVGGIFQQACREIRAYFRLGKVREEADNFNEAAGTKERVSAAVEHKPEFGMNDRIQSCDEHEDTTRTVESSFQKLEEVCKPSTASQEALNEKKPGEKLTEVEGAQECDEHMANFCSPEELNHLEESIPTEEATKERGENRHDIFYDSQQCQENEKDWNSSEFERSFVDQKLEESSLRNGENSIWEENERKQIEAWRGQRSDRASYECGWMSNCTLEKTSREEECKEGQEESFETMEHEGMAQETCNLKESTEEPDNSCLEADNENRLDTAYEQEKIQENLETCNLKENRDELNDLCLEVEDVNRLDTAHEQEKIKSLNDSADGKESNGLQGEIDLGENHEFARVNENEEIPEEAYQINASLIEQGTSNSIETEKLQGSIDMGAEDEANESQEALERQRNNIDAFDTCEGDARMHLTGSLDGSKQDECDERVELTMGNLGNQKGEKMAETNSSIPHESGYDLRAVADDCDFEKISEVETVDLIWDTCEHSEVKQEVDDASEVLDSEDDDVNLGYVIINNGAQLDNQYTVISNCNEEEPEQGLAAGLDNDDNDLNEAEISINRKEEDEVSETQELDGDAGYSDDGGCAKYELNMEAKHLHDNVISKEKTVESQQGSETSQSTEKPEENHYTNQMMDESEGKDTFQKEIETKKEHCKSIDEAKEKERAREKEKIAVERAIREARERAFAEARERAGRTAVEKATAEARQRVVEKAREKIGKTPTEANAKLTDRTSVEAKIKAERAAVERATAEARERALEKALAGKLGKEQKVGQRSQPHDPQHKGSYPSSSSRHSISSDPDVTGPGERSDVITGESAQRHKARLERHQRTAERAAKALAEKNKRDLLAQREQAEKNRLAESLDMDIKRWSSGKQGNLRALLSTLQYILGPDSGWQSVSLTEVVTTAAVKKAYRRATLCVHPDKLQQRGASLQQKYICEKVFDLLKEAWNKFSAEER